MGHNMKQSCPKKEKAVWDGSEHPVTSGMEAKCELILSGIQVLPGDIRLNGSSSLPGSKAWVQETQGHQGLPESGKSALGKSTWG